MRVAIRGFGWCLLAAFLIGRGGVVGQEPNAGTSTDVVIERVALTLKSPESYQVPLPLTPVRGITVRAAVSGVVSSFSVKTGGAVLKQAELLRFDSAELQIRLQQAQAALKIAQLEEQASTGNKEIAGLKVSIARQGVDLAQKDIDRTMVTAPFAGEVYRIHVAEGEFVTAGTPLLDLADPSQLLVEVPVDRTKVNVGDMLTVSVDDRDVSGKVEAVLPPSPALLALQDLQPSLASARIVIDNTQRQLLPGQVVRSSLIPRHPIQEIPNSSLVNSNDGTRKVQVIREGFVRDIPVQLLGAIGPTHSFVSGRFLSTDELVVKTSTPLLDGTWVRPKLQALENPKPSSGSVSPGAPAPKGPQVGF